jgi:multiple sugar transport system substrate-binding protein
MAISIPISRILAAAIILSLVITISAARVQGAAAKPFAGQSITFMAIQPHALAAQILAKQFHALTGATVNLDIVPYDQVQQKATLDVESGADKIDVFDSWYTTIGALAHDGIIQDLTSFIKQNARIVQPSDRIKSIWNPYTLYNGRRWGIPFDGDSHILFYNKTIFRHFGITGPPRTWADYDRIEKEITLKGRAHGVYGAAIMAFNAPIIMLSTFANRLGTYGGTFLDRHGRPTLDTPEAIAALSDLKRQLPYALPNPFQTAFDQARLAFLDGKVGMMEFWTDMATMAQDPAESKIINQWGAVQMPAGPPPHGRHIAPLDAGFALTLSKGSRNPKVAKAFLLFATKPSTNLMLATTFHSGIDPTCYSTINSPRYKRFQKAHNAVREALNGALAWPTMPQAPTLLQNLTNNVELALTGKESPTQALRASEAFWHKTLGK